LICFIVYLYLKRKYLAIVEVIICKQKQLNNNYNETALNLIIKDKEYKRKIEKGNSDVENYLEMLKKLQYTFYDHISSVIIQVFTEVNKLKNVNQNICVTIKHVYSHKDSDEIKVCTIWRDNESYSNGRKAGITTIQDIYKNSDFINIYMSQAEGNHYFLSNNLKKEQNYSNSSSDWQRFYNATLVVPIEIDRRKEGVIGFLCVDSLNTKNQLLFTENHVKLLISISSLIASYNYLLETLSKDTIQTYYSDKSKYKQLISEVLL
jgi:transcriptional regulator with GAF, ATPase, and Fis domain